MVSLRALGVLQPVRFECLQDLGNHLHACPMAAVIREQSTQGGSGEEIHGFA